MSKSLSRWSVWSDQEQPCERILRRHEVEQRTGLSRSAIYAEMQSGKFPKPLRLTAKAVGWTDHSISEWIKSRSPATSEE